jgi:hypothetical protein
MNTNAIVEGSTSINVTCYVTNEPSIQTWLTLVKNVEVHLVPMAPIIFPSIGSTSLAKFLVF